MCISCAKALYTNTYRAEYRTAYTPVVTLATSPLATTGLATTGLATTVYARATTGLATTAVAAQRDADRTTEARQSPRESARA